MRAALLIAPLLGLLACGPGEKDGKGKGTNTGDPTQPAQCVNPPSTVNWACTNTEEAPPFLAQVGCIEDFEAIASLPLDASIPGAISAKTVVDLLDGDTLYFMNSQTYPLHEMFVENNLVPPFHPIPLTGEFIEQYTSPNRRFVLGAITYYEEPDVWAYEIAPYDTATPEMIELAYTKIRDNAFFGENLQFHPTSEAQSDNASQLAEVCEISTDDLFQGITYQPLNLGTTTGQLAFRTAEEVDGVPIYFREIPVLDAVPNDIGITAGIITDAYQTPLSHINVLSQNRGTPNMSLIGAWENEELRALDGKWVELTVDAFGWSIREITFEEAEDWWVDNKPDPLESFPPDLTVRQITDVQDILDLDNLSKADAITASIPAFGGKCTHFGGMSLIGPDVPMRPAFGIPIAHYWDFMEANGFRDRVESWLDETHPNFDPDFQADPVYRQDKLHELQIDMMAAPLDPTFLADLTAKLEAQFPGERMRFRSSTNAEDLGAFTGAGLYTSMSGYVDDPDEPMEAAIKTVWGSVWNPRAYDEREYYSIDHLNVGMALLVSPSFPFEEVNGVAITNNIFDPSGLEPAFYINLQMDNWSVVLPEMGVTSDQVLYYFDRAGQPIVYIGHSNLIPKGYTVIDTQQMFELGTALKAIHQYFFEVYGDRNFYAMDTEFKFEDDDSADGKTRELFMKQARPYPGRGGIGR